MFFEYIACFDNVIFFKLDLIQYDMNNGLDYKYGINNFLKYWTLIGVSYIVDAHAGVVWFVRVLHGGYFVWKFF